MSSVSAALLRVPRRARRALVRQAIESLSRLGRLHPALRPSRHRVEVIRNVPYGPLSRGQRLDVDRPLDLGGPPPGVLYVHGGGFQILSKDTNFHLALAYARRGYVVFTIDYRLAPRFPYPAAMEDACRAAVWVSQHAASYGVDATRLAYAGESAGANLATGLAIAACYPRPEPFARWVYELDPRPKAVVAAAGYLQVSDPARFARRRAIPGWVDDVVHRIESAYLAGQPAGGLADPLLILENVPPPSRPFPPFFAFSSTRDPVLNDTRRLSAALGRLGVACETAVYPGELHAFHAMPWRNESRRCWRQQLQFLEGHLCPA